MTTHWLNLAELHMAKFSRVLACLTCTARASTNKKSMLTMKCMKAKILKARIAEKHATKQCDRHYGSCCGDRERCMVDSLLPSVTDRLRLYTSA